MIRLFSRAMIGAYALSVVGFLLIRIVFDNDIFFIAVFNEGLHLLLMPGLVLLPFVLILRWWYLAALLIPIVTAFGVWYGGYFLPAETPDAPPDLTLMTYNLQATRDPAQIAAMREIILAADADVVLLQELSPVAAASFGEMLAAQYPAQALHPDGQNAILGQGVLSRFPIIEDEFWRTYLSQQRVSIDLNGAPVVIYNVHAAFPFVQDGLSNRRDDIRAILARANTEQHPVILAGDFNTTERSADYQRITAAGYQDAYITVGRGFGFTYRALGRVRAARIDYVFHKADFRAVSAQVWPDSARADHHPLIVALAGIRPG